MVFKALFKVTFYESEVKLASSLIRVFEAKNKLQELLKQAISCEVSKTFDAATQFRTDSLATKVMGAITKLKGAEYLEKCIAPLVQQVSSTESYEVSFCTLFHCSTKMKVDKNRLRSGEDLDANWNRLLEAADTFIKGVLSTASEIPR